MPVNAEGPDHPAEAMQLLERSGSLERLGELLVRADAGHGACALVSGEAGIGKSALISAFVEALPAHVIRLVAGCDPLQTPRPLGLLSDIAPVLIPSLSAQTDPAAERSARLELVLGAFARLPRCAVLVCEDIHWADEASLDLLRLLVRRVQRFALLIVLSYRDDDLDFGHPLARLLGDFIGPQVLRIPLAPLSLQAVAQMVAKQAASSDAATVFKLSGGNPFFVTELLASTAGDAAAIDDSLPPTVRDAIHARLLRLPPKLREMAQVASLVPGHCEWSLLDGLFGDVAELLQQPAAAGLLRDDGATLRFRHELARQAVAASLTPAVARAWHRRLLSQLLKEAPAVAPARLAHHALHSGDVDLLRRWVEPAAAQAAQVGAHREAARLYGSLLIKVKLVPAERAALCEAWARASYEIGDVATAIAAREQALQDRIALGEVVAEGDNLRWLARLHWLRGDRILALAHSDRSLERLGSVAPSTALAWALAVRAGLHMTAEEDDAAITYAERALVLATEQGAVEVQVHALNTLGDAQQYRASDWREKLERSLALALAHGLLAHAGRAWANLVSTAVVAGNYPTARADAGAGIAFCVERDLDFWTDYLRAWLARVDAECGDFDRAYAMAAALLERPQVAPVSAVSALIAQAAAALRRGAADAATLIERAWQNAQATGEHQRIAPVLALRVEAAWLAGDPHSAAGLAITGLADAIAYGSHDNAGLFAAWLARLQQHGAIDAAAAQFEWPHRFALEIDAKWPQAAEAWAALGCHYREALARLEGDATQLHQALRQLEALGAQPAARLARERLARLGERVPRGPQPRTRADALGLTPRERQILDLLAQGQSNAAIAALLVRSPRTVEHHVARLLTKLGASSRAEAVRLSQALPVDSPK